MEISVSAVLRMWIAWCSCQYYSSNSLWYCNGMAYF